MMKKENLRIFKILIMLLSMAMLISCSKKEDISEREEDVAIELENEKELATDNATYDLEEGLKMPNIILETNKDKTFNLFETEKPVLINFWATWCPPCREEMPGLQDLYEQYGKKIDFMMINLGESKATVQDFLIESEKFTFPVAYDIINDYGYKFNIMAIPTTILIGKDKVIKKYLLGARSKEQFEEYIKEFIAE